MQDGAPGSSFHGSRDTSATPWSSGTGRLMAPLNLTQELLLRRMRRGLGLISLSRRLLGPPHGRALSSRVPRVFEYEIEVPEMCVSVVSLPRVSSQRGDARIQG